MIAGMVLGDRINARMQKLGLSQAELARRVGVAQPTIAKLSSGQSTNSKYLHSIARELQTTTAYLVGETDDPSLGAVPLTTTDSAVEMLDLVPVSEIDLSYGLGGTFADGPVEVQVHHFPRVWLQSITKSPPSSLTFARGRGDSMQPTLQDGDMVLIDLSQRTIREQDAIWALTIGDIAMIKRLRIKGPQVSILSDNDRVPADDVHFEEINVVGRVIFIGRRL